MMRSPTALLNSLNQLAAVKAEGLRAADQYRSSAALARAPRQVFQGPALERSLEDHQPGLQEESLVAFQEESQVVIQVANHPWVESLVVRHLLDLEDNQEEVQVASRHQALQGLVAQAQVRGSQVDILVALSQEWGRERPLASLARSQGQYHSNCHQEVGEALAAAQEACQDSRWVVLGQNQSVGLALSMPFRPPSQNSTAIAGSP